ncbi:hypothetical protein BDV96DRAFT_644113 [Lophiotrema nucula]|uniref:Uncharacterized protein n=1 Tax=Lophiotrema nucula TaxID=690887 RepID=A0A6A5ZF87_9PLEO|nr:hypothetical protein BDV96DRAFT_644113 [Lophiotrema nucula]
MAVRGTPILSPREQGTKVLLPRASCTNESDDGCAKPTSVPTLPVVLGVVVPIAIAAIVLFYLHRRHLRKLKEEDAKDKYKSLDFGMDPATGGKKKGEKGPDMSMLDTEKADRHGRGLSLDMGAIGSPYILPAALHGSRDSLHSLSRSTNDPHDPYRPVTFVRDDSSIRSGSRSATYRHDNSSTHTGSSGGTDRHRMNDGLLRNAQRMSQSFPPRGESMSPERNANELRYPEPAVAPLSPLNPSISLSPPPPPPPPPAQARNQAASPPPAELAYTPFKPTDPPAPPAVPEPVEMPVVEEPKPAHTAASAPLPRIQSYHAELQTNPNTASFMSDSSYGDGFKVTPPSPPRRHPEHAGGAIEPAMIAPEPLRPNNDHAGLGVDDLGYDPKRLSMSLRPLPPDDPSDNPEQRANRIRSFYKEYFDDSKPEPQGMYNDYYEDYSSEYLDGAIFDPHSNAFVVAQPQAPFAEPVTRRAMTPPPRAPPRFRSGSNIGPPPRIGHMSASSHASSRFPPRGMSSTSGTLPGPRKPLPPPSALNSLPTPAKLKEDSAIFNAMDFAPPVSFRERQNGMRPDSPLGSVRPYSPSVRPHTPLASSFDDLAAMPSPHMLRRSGTFTALDFAPPPRFRDPGSNTSDAGSIRSNRSGMSQTTRIAVRNGAYRVSRIPKEAVDTKDNMLATLRPKMDLVAPA